MAVDHTIDEYHLTPNGWITGTHYFFGDTDKQIPPPPDRVETWKQELKQQSGWSKEYITWECIWVSPNHSEEERNKLKRYYPRPE